MSFPCYPQQRGQGHGSKTFRNPLLDEQSPACCIAKHKGFYYMAFTVWDHIELFKSPILSNFREAKRRQIYRPPTSSLKRVLSPEIHSIQGELYIYFSMGPNDGNQHMFVIKCLDDDPMGNWSAETRLMPEENIYAIHGTILQYDNGGLYMIWASHGFYGHPQPADSINLYIAKMENPTTVNPPRIILRRPTMEWEMYNHPVNEAPFILQNQGRTFLIFTASHVSSSNYCLGIMGIDGGRDPMIPANWWNDVGHSVFASNGVERVWAPGHACFVRSPDDSEVWMVYDAWDDINDNGRNRRVRIQKVEWEMNGPKFPLAMGIHQDLEVPSGE